MLVTAKREKPRRGVVATGSLLCVVLFALFMNGCADAYYANLRANRRPLAPYDTYYAPDYYPYFPWDGYYGGAYYYDY